MFRDLFFWLVIRRFIYRFIVFLIFYRIIGKKVLFQMIYINQGIFTVYVYVFKIFWDLVFNFYFRVIEYVYVQIEYVVVYQLLM